MARTFTSSDSKVNFGSDPSLDGWGAFTCLTWAYVTSLNFTASTEYRIFRKLSGGFWLAGVTGDTDSFFLNVDRATTELNYQAPTANFTGLRPGWIFIAYRIDENDAAANAILAGDLNTPPAEPSSYGTEDNGSGDLADPAAGDLVVGNKENDNQQWNDPIAWVGFWDRALTDGEILTQWHYPHVTKNCQLFSHLGWSGNGGIDADWSGNGNNGTPTNASVVDHVPLGPFIKNSPQLPYEVPAAGGGNNRGQVIRVIQGNMLPLVFGALWGSKLAKQIEKNNPSTRRGFFKQLAGGE